MCGEDVEPDNFCFDKRLLSYQSWKGAQSPKSLASAGFVYTQVGDTVKCIFCNVRINKWKSSDVPLDEHLRWSKDCVYAVLLQRKPTCRGEVNATFICNY
uniref:Uncharacterized protein n=1 Tax=Photinus pyralis TaxID=7054 RepID=A0A1Y1MNY5_PHOPY